MQCRAAFFLGEQDNNDLTHDGGGTDRLLPRMAAGIPGVGLPAASVKVTMGDRLSGGASVGRDIGGVADGGESGGGLSTSLGWKTSNVFDAYARGRAAAATPDVVTYNGRSIDGSGGVGGGNVADAGVGYGGGGSGGGVIGSALSAHPRQEQPPLGSPARGVPDSGVFGRGTAAHPPPQAARTRVSPLHAAEQQPGCVVSGQQEQQAFVRGSALPSSLQRQRQQTPTQGVELAQCPANGTPEHGSATTKQSFASTAGLGAGTGGGDRASKNASQFGMVTRESSYLDSDEDKPDSKERFPAVSPGGLSMAAQAWPRRDAGGDDDEPQRTIFSSKPGVGASLTATTDAAAAAAAAPSPSSYSTTITGTLARNLSIKHRRAQEDALPQRRSKPRPGRGKAPIPEEEAGERETR